MAINKNGFSYFNIDTDRYQDIRIKRLKKDFGCTGLAVYDYLLCEIYRVEGCFLVWDESRAFDVAEYFNIKESTVNEVVAYCGTVGLFEKALLTCGMLTSKSIQKRFAEMSKRARRSNIFIPEKCCLITEESGIITEECGIITEESPVIHEESTQSKVKKSKVNNYPNGLAESESKKTKTTPIDYEKLVNYFNSETKGRFGNVRIPLSDARKKMVRARINEHGKEAFQEVISKAIKSDFLSGQTGFMMTFDWMIKPLNFEKILSGNYENRQANGSNSNNNSDRGNSRNNPIGTAKGKVFETVL